MASQEKTNTMASAQTTPVQVSTQVKRHKPDSDDSPMKSMLSNLSGDICGHCKKQCTETGEQGQAIQCDFCGVWVHAVCDGISKGQYESLVSLTSDVENIAYFCKPNSCQARFKQIIFEAVKANNARGELQSRLEKVEAKLDKIVQEVGSRLDNHSKTIESIPSSASAVEVKLNKVVQELGTKLDSHCKTIEAIPAKVPDLATTIASVTSSLATEQREKEKRQLNLILHNVPESKSSDPLTRKKEDTDFVQQVFSDVLSTPATITNAIRLGKKDSRIRLLKISVESLDQKKAILRNKLKLRKEQNSEHICKIFITPDLTPSEQRENKALRAQLTQMNQGAKKYRIKNGQIVQREPQ